MMSIIERKVLGALILLSNAEGLVPVVTTTVIARKMGYKQAGGVITMALKSLEFQNRISVTYGVKGRTSMKVLVHV
jgi:hypothetical protein